MKRKHVETKLHVSIPGACYLAEEQREAILIPVKHVDGVQSRKKGNQDISFRVGKGVPTRGNNTVSLNEGGSQIPKL